MNQSEIGVHGFGCELSVFMPMGVWEVCISTIGIPINAIAIFVIMKLKEYKKSISHWYVLQLAWADLLFLALLPLKAHEHFNGLWSFSEPLCKLFQGAFMITYHAGILFLMVMSFDRYIAIVHPVNAFWRKFRTRKTSFIVTGIVWFVALAFSIPIIVWAKKHCSCSLKSSSSVEIPIEDIDEFFNHTAYIDNPAYEDLFVENNEDHYATDGNFYDLVEHDLVNSEHQFEGSGIEEAVCFKDTWQGFRIWLIMSFVFDFFLPVVVMVVCYSLILKRVLQPTVSSSIRSSGSCSSTSDALSQKRNGKSETKHRHGSTSSQHARKLKQQRKITYIVVTLVLAFLLCWSPFQFVQLARTRSLNLPQEACNQLVDTATILAYANSMINPILYTVLGSRFLRRLSTALRGFGIRKRGSTFSRSSLKSLNRGTSLKNRTIVTTAHNKSVSNTEMSMAKTTHSESTFHQPPSYSPDNIYISNPTERNPTKSKTSIHDEKNQADKEKSNLL